MKIYFSTHIGYICCVLMATTLIFSLHDTVRISHFVNDVVYESFTVLIISLLCVLYCLYDTKMPEFCRGHKWLRTLKIFRALNRSSCHSSGHIWDKPSSACGWLGVFSRGSPVFPPPYD